MLNAASSVSTASSPGDMSGLVAMYKSKSKEILEGDILRVRQRVAPDPQPMTVSPVNVTRRRVSLPGPQEEKPPGQAPAESPPLASPPRAATAAADIDAAVQELLFDWGAKETNRSLSRPVSALSGRLGRGHRSPQRQTESQVVVEGIKNQIAADTTSTMLRILSLFVDPVVADGSESQGGSSSTASLGKVFISSALNESLRSASTQWHQLHPQHTADPEGCSGQRTDFTASKYDVLLETLTKRTADRFGIGQTEARKLSNEAQRQLASLASRGFSIRCLQRPAMAFPIAIIFDPLVEMAEWDSVTGAESTRFKCKLKCMLVGTLHRVGVDDGILGHPNLSRASMTTAATLNSVVAFEQKARRERRLKRIAEHRQLQQEAMRESQETPPEERTPQHTHHRISIAASTPERLPGDVPEDELEALRRAAKLPSDLKSLLADKAKRDSQPLRTHKELPSVMSEHVVSYDLCTVEPHQLIVYEEVDLKKGRPLDLINAVVTNRSSLAWNEGKYSKIEYTMRWNIPIAEVGCASLKDEWVRRRLTFPAEAHANWVPLNTVLAACKRGAASIDLVDEAVEGPRFEYRHSFTFSKLKLAQSTW
jgi:hypothetical protein